MKKNILLAISALALTIGISSCHKDRCHDSYANNYGFEEPCRYTQAPAKITVIFMTDSDSFGKIRVWLTSKDSADVTATYPDWVSCNDPSGCASFTVPAGTYTYRAECTNWKWTDNVTVSDDCNVIWLNNHVGKTSLSDPAHGRFENSNLETK